MSDVGSVVNAQLTRNIWREREYVQGFIVHGSIIVASVEIFKCLQTREEEMAVNFVCLSKCFSTSYLM